MENLSLDVTAFSYAEYKTSPEESNLMNIVIEFWKKADVVSAVIDESWMFYGRMMDLPDTDNFRREYISVREKVRKSILTDHRRESALNLVEPIGLLICEWVELNTNVDRLYATEALNSIVFESPYSIDYSSSMNLWVQNCKDEATRTFVFSNVCYFCMESKVFSVWNCLPQRVKLAFFFVSMNTKYGLFLHYWIHKLVRKIPIFMQEFEKYVSLHWQHVSIQSEEFLEVNVGWLMLRFSVFEGNPSAVQYFYQNLTPEQKFSHLPICLRAAFLCDFDNYTGDPKFVHIIHYLYAQMDRLQQLLFLRDNQQIFVVLIAKYWQCQRRAVPIIKMSWNVIRAELYQFIIKIIARRIAEGRYVREHLLESIWEITPERMRKKFFSSIVIDTKCLEIFSESTVSAIKQILRDANTEERNKILSFYEV